MKPQTPVPDSGLRKSVAGLPDGQASQLTSEDWEILESIEFVAQAKKMSVEDVLASPEFSLKAKDVLRRLIA